MGFQQVLNMGLNHLAASQFLLRFSHGRKIQPQPLQDGTLRNRVRKGRRRSWGCCQPWAEGLGLTWGIRCLGAPQSKPDPPYPLSLTCEALRGPDRGGGVGGEVIARVVGGVNLQGQKGDGQQCHPELAVPSQWHPPPAGTLLAPPSLNPQPAQRLSPVPPINPGVSLCPRCHHPQVQPLLLRSPLRRKQELSGIVARCTARTPVPPCKDHWTGQRQLSGNPVRPVPSSLNQYMQGKDYWDLQVLPQGLCRVVLAEQHQAGRAHS